MTSVCRWVVGVVVVCGLVPTEAMAQPAEKVEYRVIATSKTSTMEKELNEAAEAGRRS